MGDRRKPADVAGGRGAVDGSMADNRRESADVAGRRGAVDGPMASNQRKPVDVAAIVAGGHWGR